MACSRYQFRYGAGGVLSATYYTCGDNTPVDITYTGGVSGALFLSAGLVCGAGPGIVIASSSPAPITYTGFASAGGALVAGFVYPVILKPFQQYVTTTTTFLQLTALEVPPINP
jgi:hypothetical protein